MEIGKRIKNLRLRMGLTQEELADRSDLTKGFISQLEHDNTSPSVDTLGNIVEALGTTMAKFFKDESEEEIVFSADDAAFREDDALGYRMHWIVANAQSREMEPVTITLKKGGRSKQYEPFEGESFGYVMSGEVTLHYGEQTFVLSKGDSFYIEANQPFWVENHNGKGQSRMMWITTPPIF